MVVVFLSGEETLLILETVASGLVLLSGGRLGEAGDEADEEGEAISLLMFNLAL